MHMGNSHKHENSEDWGKWGRYVILDKEKGGGESLVFQRGNGQFTGILESGQHIPARQSRNNGTEI